MGIFSSKKKHYVDTQVVRLVDDETVPSMQSSAMIQAIFTGSDMIDPILTQSLNGAFRNFEKMYRFARDGNYFYGLPNANDQTTSDGFARAQIVLDAFIGSAVTIDFLHFRPLNNFHMGWKHITDALAYNHATNEIVDLSAQEGFDVYLEKMVAVHTTGAGLELEQASLGTYGSSASQGVTPARLEWENPAVLENLVIGEEERIGAGETESVEIHYIWLDGTGDIQRDFTVVSLAAYDTDQEYYQARYTVISTGVIGYWLYDPKIGADTILNEIFDTPSSIDPGTYFPFVVFRSEGTDRSDPGLSGTPAYDTSVELLNKIGIDFAEMGEAMHEDVDIGDVDQAVMMMAVPITTTNEAEMDYLWRYFDDLYQRLPTEATKEDYTSSPGMSSRFGRSAAPTKSYSVKITDADFDMTISFDSILRALKPGSIGTIGTITNGSGSRRSPSIVFKDGERTGVAQRATRILRKQISLNVYEEMMIVEPHVRYQIYKSLGVEAGVNDDRMMIPLDYDVTRKMSALKVEELYYRSLHFIFNSHVTQTIKWYQRGVFQIVLLVIAIVLTIYTYGKTWKAIAAALPVGTAAIVITLLTIIVVVFVPLVLEVVFKEVAKALGVENTFWLAIVIMIYGGYRGIKAGGFVAGSTAVNLLRVVTGLFSGARAVLQDMMSDLIDDMENFRLEQTEAQKELDRANELLGIALEINPFTFIGDQPKVIFGESPDDYYNRTIHSGNIGTQSMKIVQNFVEISLTLPTITETLGAF